MWVGCGKVLGICQGGATGVMVFTRLMLILIWQRGCLPACFVAGGRGRGKGFLTQGQWQLFLWPSPLSHTTQFLPVCLWCPSNCCPFAGAQGECLWGSEHVCGPFKRVPRFPNVFHFTQIHQIPADFHSQMWWLFFLPLVLCGGQPGVGWDSPHSLGGPTQLSYRFGFSTTTCGCGASLFHVSTLLQSCGGFFFISLFIGLLFRSSSNGSPGWLFFNLVIILGWSWE